MDVLGSFLLWDWERCDIWAADEIAYQSPAVEADHQRMFLISCFQIFRHQDINTDPVLIDDFVAGAVDVEGGELFGIQGCGGESHFERQESLF